MERLFMHTTSFHNATREKILNRRDQIEAIDGYL